MEKRKQDSEKEKNQENKKERRQNRRNVILQKKQCWALGR